LIAVRIAFPTQSSEIKLQPKLNNPRVGGGQDLTEAARVAHDVRRAKIRKEKSGLPQDAGVIEASVGQHPPLSRFINT